MNLFTLLRSAGTFGLAGVLACSGATEWWSPVVFDDFDQLNHSVGASPSGWSVTNPAGTSVRIISTDTAPTNAAGPGYGLRLADTSSTAGLVASRQPTGSNQAVLRADFRARRLNADTTGAALVFAMGNGVSTLNGSGASKSRVLSVDLKNSGSVGVDGAAGTGVVLSASAANLVQIVANSSDTVVFDYEALDGSGSRALAANSFDLYVNGTLELVDRAFVPNADNGSMGNGEANLGRAGFFTFNGTNVIDWAIDEFQLMVPSAAEFGWNRLLDYNIAWKAPTTSSPHVNLSAITGAPGFSESGLTEIWVDGAAASNGNGTSGSPYNTFLAGLQAARTQLVAGNGVHVRVRPAIYREDLSSVSFETVSPAFKNAPLVISGAVNAAGHRPVFKGSDVLPTSGWTDLGNGLYRRAWDGNLPKFTPSYGSKEFIAHRTEMVFLNGLPLTQNILEGHRIVWNNSQSPTYAYVGSRDPSVLVPGSFAITEYESGGPMLYVKLPHGFTPVTATLEAAKRVTWIDFARKNNLKLRNLVIEHWASNLTDVGRQAAVRFQTASDTEASSDNVTLDGCVIRWNNAHGLKPSGSDWTVRNTEIVYNGISGINGDARAGQKFENSIFEDLSISFNGWRTAWGHHYSFYTAGSKMHRALNNRYSRVFAAGNTSPGLWYDIHSINVFNEDIIAVSNQNNGIFWELSAGPFHGNRIISAYNRGQANSTFKLAIVGKLTLENSIGYASGIATSGGSPDGTMNWLQWNVRATEHGAEEVFAPLGYTFRNVVLVGGPNVKAIQHFVSELPLDHPNSGTFTFTGVDNTVYHQTPSASPLAARFVTSDRMIGSGGYLAAKTTAEWQAYPGISETNLSEADPQFLGLESGDFRLASTSPLNGTSRGTALPTYVIPASVLLEAEHFNAWRNLGTNQRPSPQPAYASGTGGLSGLGSVTVTTKPTGSIFDPAGTGVLTATAQTTFQPPKSYVTLGNYSVTWSLADAYGTTRLLNQGIRVNGDPISAPWTLTDIGMVTAAAVASKDTDQEVFELKSEANDTWGTADSVSFIHQAANGDSAIETRITKFAKSTNGDAPDDKWLDPFAKTGVMMRSGTGAGAVTVFLNVTPENGVRLQVRSDFSAATTTVASVAGLTQPVWLRLVRTGSTFTGYYSTDGGAVSTWTALPSAGNAPNMPSAHQIGLALSTHRENKANTVIFSSVAATP